MVEPTSRGAQAALRLQATTDEIVNEVERLPPALITWIPADNVWSVMDILCHIREFVPFWTGETLRIAGHPEELWGRDHTDTARLAAVTNTAAQGLDAVLSEIRHAIGRTSATLRDLGDSALATEATSKNPRWGRKPASFVVDHLLVEHMEKHLGQIRRNVSQFAERAANAHGRLEAESP